VIRLDIKTNTEDGQANVEDGLFDVTIIEKSSLAVFQEVSILGDAEASEDVLR
jgi:hypothetical protein